MAVAGPPRPAGPVLEVALKSKVAAWQANTYSGPFTHMRVHAQLSRVVYSNTVAHRPSVTPARASSLPNLALAGVTSQPRDVNSVRLDNAVFIALQVSQHEWPSR